ncbi:major facilitator superfamily MFS_1 [Actinobacteria bacterium OK074]|nr:major facilitator superfamily MFS_1 [Actinobacteria bacterium OK074]
MASYIDAATIVTVGVSMVLFQKPFHLSSWTVGALSSALTLAFATGAVVGGRLGDLLGRRAVYSVDLVVYAAGVLAVIVAPTQAVLFAGIIVTGLAMGADVPTSLALVAEEAPTGRQSGAVAYSQTLWLAGVMVTQIISFAVADLGALGARLLFVHLFVVAVVVWIMRRGVTESARWQESRTAPRALERQRLRAMFRRPYGSALAATALFFIVTGALPNTIGQFGPYLIVNLGHSTTRTFTVIGIATLVLGLLIALLFQRVADARAPRTVLVVLGLVTLVLGPLVPVLGGFGLASLVVLYTANTVSGTWAGEGLYKVWSQEIFPTEIRSTAQGLTYGATRYCLAGFGFLTPTLADRSPSLLMLMLAVLGLVGAGVALLWIPRLPRHGRDDFDGPQDRAAARRATAPEGGLRSRTPREAKNQ